MNRRFPLGMFLTASIGVWAAACFFTNGSAILLYLGLHVLTTGAFAWEIRRIEDSIKRPATSQAKPAAPAASRAA